MYTPINIFSKISKGDEISLLRNLLYTLLFIWHGRFNYRSNCFLLLTLRNIAIKQQSMSNIMVYTMIRYPVR